MRIRNLLIKKFVPLIGVLLVLLPQTSLRAQARHLSAYLGGGLTMPVAPEAFRDNHNVGFNIFAAVRYPIGPYTELFGRLEYHLITIDFGEYFGTNINLDGGGIDILFLGTDIKQYARRTSASFRPFLLAGGGWSRLSQSGISTDLAFEQYAPLLMENQSRFYYNIGVGSDIRLASSLNLFVLCRYLEIQQDADNLKLVPFTVGVRL